MTLSSFITLQGVLQAAIADDSGRLLECSGAGEVPTTAVLVLANATLSAANELGSRSGDGHCVDVIQQHESGFIYLRRLPQHRLLMVRCLNDDSLSSIRSLGRQFTSTAAHSLHGASPVSLDLAAALHAEPSW